MIVYSSVRLGVSPQSNALATVLMATGVIALAVPGSAAFAGEFAILAGVFQQGWGYAVFGRVTDGMDVVRDILAQPRSLDAGEGAMKGQMLELQRPDTAPQLVPAVDLQAAAKALYQSQLRMLAAGTDLGRGGSTGGSTGNAMNNTMGSSMSGSMGSASSTSEGSSFTADSRPMVAETKAVQAVNVASKVELPPAQAKELTWGRYAWSPQLSGDDFSRMYEAALMQGKQSLGGNGAFSLLRTQTDIANFTPPSEGVAKFRLANASAGVIGLDSKLIEAVKVNQASLDVNFANATYATQLQLQAPVMGQQVLASSGGINANGTLRVDAGNTYLFGGFNSNGKEAGYLFQKAVPNGILMGTTLWGR